MGTWRLIFYITAGVNIGTNLFYVVFASAKEQTWSHVQLLDDSDDNNDNDNGNIFNNSNNDKDIDSRLNDDDDDLVKSNET